MDYVAANQENNSKNIVKKTYSRITNSLGWKITLFIILFSLIPTVASSGVISGIQINQRQEEIENDALALSEYINQEFTAVLESYKSHVLLAATLEESVRLMLALQEDNFTQYKNQWPTEDLTNGSLYVNFFRDNPELQETYDSVLDVFSVMSRENDEIDLIRIFAPDGNMVVGSNNGSEILSDYRGDKIWHKRMSDITLVKPNETYFSAINIARFTQSGALRVMHPIDVDSKRLGFAIINYNLKGLSKTLLGTGIQAAQGEEFSPLIIDANYENAEGKRLGPVIIQSPRYRTLEFNEEESGVVLGKASLEEQGRSEITIAGKKTTFFYVRNSFLEDLPIQREIYIGLEVPTSALAPNYNPTILTLSIVIALTVLAGLLFGRGYSLTLTRTLSKLKDTTSEIVQGNLTAPMDERLLERKDELGEIARLFDQTRTSIISLLRPTISTTEQVSGYMEQLFLASSEVLKQNSELGTTFQEIARSVGDQAELNNQVLALITQHNEVVDQMMFEIQNTLEVLRDTIEETTFIALNAQIEAARAGAVGRGFMVVASSIRDLATKGKERLKEIDQKISVIQDTVKNSVDQVIINTESLSASAEEIAAISEESVAGITEQIGILKEMTILIRSLNNMTRDLKQEANKFSIGNGEGKN